MSSPGKGTCSTDGKRLTRTTRSVRAPVSEVTTERESRILSPGTHRSSSDHSKAFISYICHIEAAEWHLAKSIGPRAGSNPNRFRDPVHLGATEHLRSVLREIIRDLGSLLDAGRRDFNRKKEVDLGELPYIGVDVVASEIIERKQSVVRRKKPPFHDDLPKVDLILWRDRLTPFAQRKRSFGRCQFWLSVSTYLMTTSHPLLMENVVPVGFDC